MVDKQGTGDVLGRIEVDGQELVRIEDDGDDDRYAEVYIMGERISVGKLTTRDGGDDNIIDLFERANGQTSESTSSSGDPSYKDLIPKSAGQKCRSCNKTYPRDCVEERPNGQIECDGCWDSS